MKYSEMELVDGSLLLSLYKDVFPHQVYVDDWEIADESEREYTETYRWCRKRFGRQRYIMDLTASRELGISGFRVNPNGIWDYYDTSYYFVNAEDALLFMLTFGKAKPVGTEE